MDLRMVKNEIRMKYTILGFISLIALHSAGQFAPPAGQPGTTAIHKDSSAIVAWASGIEVVRGLINISNPSAEHEGSNYASFGEPSNALGQASGTSEQCVSFGDGGIATLTFAHPIQNGEGPDFCVFENGFTDTYLELAFVEVSSDGEHFVRFPSVSLTQTTTQIDGFGSLDATKIHNLAGKYRQGYGTPFDLQDLADSTGIDLEHITHVRIVDVVGSIDPAYARYDSQGNAINDLFPTPFNSGGFDLDAVGVIHQKQELSLSSYSSNPIQVYPNPFSEQLTMITNQEVYEVIVHDLSGKIAVHERTGFNGKRTMHLPVDSGVFLLTVVGEWGTWTTRIIKY
jgi:hypothetical protein